MWPSGCEEVPDYCFFSSKLETITNIDNVKKIGQYAFANTPNLCSVNWPKGCLNIPEGCFEESGLREIHNIEKVSNIERFAFRDSGLEEIDLSKTFISFIGKDALYGVNKDKITLPFYLAEEDM